MPAQFGDNLLIRCAGTFYIQALAVICKMRQLSFTLILSSLAFSCDTFTESRIVDNQDELKEIVDIALKHNIQKFEWGDTDIEGLNWKLQKRQIDHFEVRLEGDTRTTMANYLDSVVVFTRKSKNIFDKEDNIVYDLAKNPRKLGSLTVEMAACEQIMVTDRWYLVTIGFD